MNTPEIIQALANMPVHSPEWLENPSVRVELSAIVYEARKLNRDGEHRASGEQNNMSTNTKHTPGPWKYQRDIEMVVSGHQEWNQSGICKVASGEDSRHDEPNARLIAAAPELLEALQAVMNCQTYYYLDLPYEVVRATPEFCEALDKVQKAIAKATEAA